MVLIKHEPRNQHRCYTPGLIARRKENIGPGSIWQCETCNTRWKLVGDEDSDYWIVEPPKTGAYGMQMKEE